MTSETELRNRKGNGHQAQVLRCLLQVAVLETAVSDILHVATCRVSRLLNSASGQGTVLGIYVRSWQCWQLNVVETGKIERLGHPVSYSFLESS